MAKKVTSPFGKKLNCLGTLFLLLLISALPASASIKGSCSGCHTMHNSQDGSSMNFNTSETPNASLLRGTCLGCHAQGGGSARVATGADMIPQVFHTESTDLAGGNFAFITGAKGSGASDGKGHNIAELTGSDSTIGNLPGGIQQSFHETSIVNTSTLTCAGTNGCHGARWWSTNGLPAGTPIGIDGAHHSNTDGKLDAPDSIGNSYRFLTGVKGLEDDDWQYTRTSSDHNEYFGMTEPVQLGCSGGAVVSCHSGQGNIGLGIQSPDGTMSQYCATCHGNFHTIQTNASSGIGSSASSPFIRHPTDLVLSQKAGDEYSFYTLYDVNVPVARTTVPDFSSDTVSPTIDAVNCMSCHVAHASNYPDMLRWDYAAECNTNGGGNTACGCFTCHTAKDGDSSQ